MKKGTFRKNVLVKTNDPALPRVNSFHPGQGGVTAFTTCLAVGL